MSTAKLCLLPSYSSHGAAHCPAGGPGFGRQVGAQRHGGRWVGGWCPGTRAAELRGAKPTSQCPLCLGYGSSLPAGTRTTAPHRRLAPPSRPAPPAGAIGLVAAPAIGASQEGFKGFAKGAAAGVAGAVLLPVTGVVVGAVQVRGRRRAADRSQRACSGMQQRNLCNPYPTAPPLVHRHCSWGAGR